MEEFSKLKLNRAVWIALIEQKKFLEAAHYYGIYMDYLTDFKTDNPEIDKLRKYEIDLAAELYISRLKEAANRLSKEGDYPNAAICYTELYRLNSKDFDIIENYANTLDKIGQYDLELDLLSIFESNAQDNPKTYKLIAEVYDKIGVNKKSTQYYEKYIEKKGLDNTTADEYNVLGCFYNKLYSDDTHKLEDLRTSLKYFEIASDMDPACRIFAKNATIMAGKGMDNDSCYKHWQRVLKTNQMTNDDKYDYAAFCLRTERFDEWHKYFDARFKKENNPTYFPEINRLRWDGIKNLSSSTLLVHYEQGFGDTILMWGYFPRLVKLAKHVIYVVQNELYPLLKDNDLGVEVIAKRNADLNNLKYNYYLPSMSIPIVLKLTRENISVGEGFIKPDKELVEKYKNEFFDNNKLKIGLSFAGSNTGNKTRDMSIDKFLPLDNIDNVELYSITKDVTDEQLSCFKNNKVINLGKTFRDFADTAAAMENCDLIISTDNVLMNLAGALGKKTFGLFNYTNEFRYFDLTGDNIVWLTSVKPFVCDDIDHWEFVIDKVADEIKKITESK